MASEASSMVASAMVSAEAAAASEASEASEGSSKAVLRAVVSEASAEASEGSTVLRAVVRSMAVSASKARSVSRERRAVEGAETVKRTGVAVRSVAVVRAVMGSMVRAMMGSVTSERASEWRRWAVASETLASSTLAELALRLMHLLHRLAQLLVARALVIRRRRGRGGAR